MHPDPRTLQQVGDGGQSCLIYGAGTRIQTLKVIEFYVTQRYPVPTAKKHMVLIPNDSLEEFWLGLDDFNYTPSGKNGCGDGQNKRQMLHAF